MKKLNIMKKSLFLLLFTLVQLTSFSQSTIELDLSEKEYKKISKKLDLNIVNRGFDGVGKIWVSETIKEAKKLWDAALFEMNVPQGEVVDESADVTTIDADWIIEIDPGNLSGRIKDFTNNNKVILTFVTEHKMWGIYTPKRAKLFKKYVKVIFNEILLSIK
tara:strand:+ start:209 stop:694 length:486 start_codon:yes stop_codon:yes gene_type:complete